jgi:hypothetical protein
VTLRVKVVVLVNVPPVPEMVIVEVATGVATVVVIVRVEVQVGLHDVGENEAVAPAGRPEAEKDTPVVVPEANDAVAVLVTADPWTTDLLPPFAIVKSKVGGGGGGGVTPVPGPRGNAALV